MFRTAIYGMLVSVAIFGGNSAAIARNANMDVTEATVRLEGLDLATDAGASLLRQRVARAVRSVCGQASVSDLRGSAMMMKCRQDAQARAHKQVELAVNNARQMRYAGEPARVARRATVGSAMR